MPCSLSPALADNHCEVIFGAVKTTFHIARPLCVLLFVLWLSPTLAQEVKDEIPTGKVDKKVKDKSKTPKEKTMPIIYVEDAKKHLIGNPCALEATRAMRFEYEILHRPDERFWSKWHYFWNNTGVKTRLFFTRGPWWKSKINKKFKQCAFQSGDFRA